MLATGLLYPNFDSLGRSFLSLLMSKFNNGHFLALGNCCVLFLIKSETLKVTLFFSTVVVKMRLEEKQYLSGIFTLLQRNACDPEWSHKGCCRNNLSPLHHKHFWIESFTCTVMSVPFSKGGSHVATTFNTTQVFLYFMHLHICI